jgi:membrane protease YdiL (CAAX protease family)
LDGWLALGFWVFYMVLLWAQGWLLAAGPRWVGQLPHGLAVVGPGVLIELGVIALIIRCRRQSWSDVGLGRTSLLRSGLVGLGLGAVLVVCGAIIPTVIQHASFYQPQFIADQALWFLVWVALPEEIVFRGFIMTHLAGFSRRWSLPTSAVMFGLSHFPFQFAISGLPLESFLAQNSWMILIPTGWGLIYGLLYAKFNHVLGPVIAHALADTASMGISPVAL